MEELPEEVKLEIVSGTSSSEDEQADGGQQMSMVFDVLEQIDKVNK